MPKKDPKALLYEVAGYLKGRKEEWSTIYQVAEATGTETRTIMRYIDNLFGNGFLEIKHEKIIPKRGRPVTVYRIKQQFFKKEFN